MDDKPMLITDLVHRESAQAREDLDRAARAALVRVIDELEAGPQDFSRAATIAGIASAMGYGSSMLRQLLAGASWPAQAIAALAQATSQKPGQMLAREEQPATKGNQ